MFNFSKYKSRENLLLLGICIIFLLVWVYLASQTGTQWAQDSHWQMSLAKNLADGNGYTLEGVYPHSQYPPGLPVLILPFYLLLGNVQLAGLILMGILALLTIVLTYNVGKSFSKEVGLIAAFLLAAHNLFLFNSVSVMTEMPFMFFSLLGLFLFAKGFENTKYFLLAFPTLAYCILIRYPGAFLILPMLYLLLRNFKRTKEIILSDKFLIGIFLGILVVSPWLIRNFMAFHNPFYTSYSNQFNVGFFKGLVSFSKLFFYLGPLFSTFSLMGILSLIKSKNNLAKMFLVWLFVYFIIHSIWWGGGIFRFYASILPVISLFCSFGIVFFTERFTRKTKTKNKLIVIILLVILVIQMVILFSGIINQETTIKTISRYDSVRDAVSWADVNLPKGSIYVVPDVAVYSLYSNNKDLMYYSEGVNWLLQESLSKENIFIFADNLHPWLTGPYMQGESGKIIINSRTPQGRPIGITILVNLINKEQSPKFGLGSEDYENSTALIFGVKDITAQYLNN